MSGAGSPGLGVRPARARATSDQRQIATTGVLATSIVGGPADGTIGLIDLRADKSVVATLTNAVSPQDG